MNERVRTALLVAIAIEGAIGAWSAHELVEAVHEGFGMEIQVEQAEELAADVDEKVSDRITVGVPIDERRWATEEGAKNAMYGIPEPEPPKPVVVVDNRNIPKREDLRVVKLDRKVFVVELRKSGVWNEVKTFKTITKANEWCAVNSK